MNYQKRTALKTKYRIYNELAWVLMALGCLLAIFNPTMTLEIITSLLGGVVLYLYSIIAKWWNIS